jgi:ABC-type amino acid transport substrate-binding protein
MRDHGSPTFSRDRLGLALLAIRAARLPPRGRRSCSSVARCASAPTATTCRSRTEAGEGFENRIAEMMADDLGLELTYVWAPQIMGFVRNTLQLRVCDVIIGVVAGYELVQNTNAYYRSVYAFVLPHDAVDGPTSLTDEALRGKVVGVVSDTPPIDPVAPGRRRVKSYHLQVDTRATSPARDADRRCGQRRHRGAVIWGPIAGWYAARHDPPSRWCRST